MAHRTVKLQFLNTAANFELLTLVQKEFQGMTIDGIACEYSNQIGIAANQTAIKNVLEGKDDLTLETAILLLSLINKQLVFSIKDIEQSVAPKNSDPAAAWAFSKDKKEKS